MRGVIDIDDLGKIMVQLNAPFSDQDLEEITHQAKKMGLGQITEDTFKDLLEPLLVNPDDNDNFHIEGIFRMLDVNQNGKVNGQELGKILGIMYGEKLSKNHITQMMKVINPQDEEGMDMDEFIDIIKFK